MKRKLRTIAKNFKGKERVLVTLLFAFVLSTMSIGYAYYQTEVSLEANITLLQGELVIEDATKHTANNATINGEIEISKTENNSTVILSSEYNVTLNGSDNNNYIDIRYTITNSSRHTYTYTGFSDSFTIYDGADPNTLREPKLYGIIPGDKLEPGDSRTVDLIYISSSDVETSTFTVVPTFIFDSNNPDVAIPSLEGSLDATKVTLRDDDLAQLNVKVINGFDTTVGYTLSLSTDKYILTNSSGVVSSYDTVLEPAGNIKTGLYISLVDESVRNEETTTDLIATLEDGTEYILGTFTIGKEVVADLPYVKAETNEEKTYVNTGWGRYILTVDVTNNYETAINNFTVYIYPKDTSSIASVGSWDNTVTYEDGVIKLTSIALGTNNSISIEPGETYTSGEIIIEYVPNKTFEVDRYEVYAIAENINGNQTGIYTESILKGADPVLPTSDNLFIPVTIANDGTVTRATASEEWYKYSEGKWANAVILKTTNRANWYYAEGTTITQSDIEDYLVWIPRYKYKLFNVTTTNESVPTQSIQIQFETTDVEPSTGNVNGSYLTHPAFTDINKNGFWIGKFEVTNNYNTLPNATSLRNTSFDNFYSGLLGYKTTYGSHLTTNMEWGAASYLAYSKYGRGTTEISMNTNSNGRTGCSATANNAASTECLNSYGSATSYPQSTTGNISGIFDMSGGSYEYTAATIKGEKSGSYYTLYDTVSSILLGDGVTETKLWYGNRRGYFSNTEKYLVRGGNYTEGDYCTVFNFWRRNGAASNTDSARVSFDI